MIRRGRMLAALAMGLAPLALAPTASQAQLFINVSVHIGPPALPVYDQPPIPAPNYIWAPGYWAWDDWWGDYYWVPGTWVMAPRPGLLWTPGWWGWNDGAYAWHGGYWGPHVGWYGGISYGFGYNGSGYFGGEWRGGNFFYNRSVTNVGNGSVTNVFNRTVVNNTTIINNHNVSYSGGPGGVAAQPTPEQRMAMNEPHIDATPQQVAHSHAAQANRAAFASVNHGRPAVLAQARPHPAPAGPIHPPGMARPAPGGGLPGAGARGAPRSVPGGAGPAEMSRTGGQRENPNMTETPHTVAHPERPDVAGMRPEQSDGPGGGMHEREVVAPPAVGVEHPVHPPRSIEHGADGALGGGRMEDHAPPVEHPRAAAPRPPQAPPPPHRPPPPPAHHAPPHESGHPGNDGEHHHD